MMTKLQPCTIKYRYSGVCYREKTPTHLYRLIIFQLATAVEKIIISKWKLYCINTYYVNVMTKTSDVLYICNYYYFF